LLHSVLYQVHESQIQWFVLDHLDSERAPLSLFANSGQSGSSSHLGKIHAIEY